MNIAKLSQKRKQTVLALAEKIAKYELNSNQSLSSPSSVRRYLSVWLTGKHEEMFVVIFLNTQHQIISTECLFNGSIDSCAVHPRVVVKRALELNAAALILAHNHPSGNNEISSADRVITDKITEAAKLFEIRILDHLVVGTLITSFAEKGYL